MAFQELMRKNNLMGGKYSVPPSCPSTSSPSPPPPRTAGSHRTCSTRWPRHRSPGTSPRPGTTQRRCRARRTAGCSARCNAPAARRSGQTERCCCERAGIQCRFAPARRCPGYGRCCYGLRGGHRRAPRPLPRGGCRLQSCGTSVLYN